MRMELEGAIGTYLYKLQKKTEPEDQMKSSKTLSSILHYIYLFKMIYLLSVFHLFWNSSLHVFG